MVNQISQYINNMRNSLELMIDQRPRPMSWKMRSKKAHAYCEKVKPLFDDIRKNADYIERYCPDMHWAPAEVQELLFVR